MALDGVNGMENKILVVGDSHACFWGGKNAFDGSSINSAIDILHVGPATAYKASSGTSTVDAKGKIFRYLSENREKYSALILSFGEIDCRTHIIKHAAMKGLPLKKVVESVVSNYLHFALEVSTTFDIPCLFWGPIASSPPSKLNFNPATPTVGSISERNYVTRLMNDMLSQEAANFKNIGHCTIFDMMVDSNGVTIAEFLHDGCHLTSGAFKHSLIVLQNELRRLRIDVNLHNKNDLSAPTTPYEKNVSAGLSFEQSSFLPGTVSRAFSEHPDGKINFHTRHEDKPWIALTLDSAYVLSRIEIHNRKDSCAFRARSIVISISIDREKWVDIFSAKSGIYPFDEDHVLRISFEKLILARFIKISLREQQFLHLGCVKIFALSYA